MFSIIILSHFSATKKKAQISMQGRLFSNEIEHKQHKLQEVLQKYEELAGSNPVALRALIPSDDMWRLFVEESVQTHGRGFSQLPHYNEYYSKALHLTVEEYSKQNTANAERDYDELDKKFPGAACRSDEYKKLSEKIEKLYERIDLNYNLDNLSLSKFKYASLNNRFTLQDIVSLDNGLAVFELNEPNYFKSLYRAFDHIFDADTSADLITTIKHYHELATMDVLEQVHPGCFRPAWHGEFSLIYEQTCSRDGLSAILKNNRDYISFRFVEKGVGARSVKCSDTKIEDLISMLTNPKYYVCLQSYYFGMEFYEKPNEASHRQLLNCIQRYELAMKAAINPLEKLKAIIIFVQDCEQLHPFSDGNCRTFCMLVLNDLLKKNGFPLTILSDPNKFDGFSPDELVDEVIQGMSNVFELIATQKLFGVTTASMIEDLRKIKQPEVKEMLAYFDELNDMERANRKRFQVALPSNS